MTNGTRRECGVSVTPRALLTPGKDPVPIVQKAGWAPGPVWTGAENLAPHRDSIPGPSLPCLRFNKRPGKNPRAINLLNTTNNQDYT